MPVLPKSNVYSHQPPAGRPSGAFAGIFGLHGPNDRPLRRPLRSALVRLSLGVLLLSPAARPCAAELTYGPLAHEFQMTLESGRRREVVGSLFSTEAGQDWQRWAVSPFMRYSVNHGIDSTEFDLLYPLITYDRYGAEYRLRLLFFTTFGGGQNQEEEQARRFTLFPWIFWQRSANPDENYAAVFPLHGRIKNRMNRDEAWWTAWPLYIGSRRKDVVTHNYLYPLVHVRRGDHLKGWQVWPLLGSERQDPAWRTNDYGDLTLVPGHRKSFALWPVHFSQDLGLGTTNIQTHRMFLPFYSYSHSPAGDSRSWLWPFFNVIHNREKDYREYQMPFPFVVFTRGPGETTDRVLPFYSRSVSPTAESGFLLWPLYKVNRIKAPPLLRERNRLMFFLYSDVRETNTLRQTVHRRVDLWPLVAYRRDHEGRERWQAPALIESFLPQNRAVDHVYSPLWAVWRQEHNPEANASSQSLLWNFYRRDHSPTSTKVSLCFGMFQYQSSPGGRRLKLLFVPLSRAKTRAPDPPAAAPDAAAQRSLSGRN
jgi:hypothetical protein